MNLVFVIIVLLATSSKRRALTMLHRVCLAINYYSGLRPHAECGQQWSGSSR